MIPDESLIRAASGEGTDAVDAFRSWTQSRNLDELDPAELRLLPLVYRNLRNSAIADENIPSVAKQIYKATWLRTRRLLPQVVATISLLEERGIETLLLKGAALVASYYRDVGVRPMSDFDLLVHPSDVERATDALEEHGWTPATKVTADAVTYLHAVVFKKEELTCDLHWRALWESRRPRIDDAFWRGSEEVSFETLRARILRPEHQLLHVIVHGTRRLDRTAHRWIIDALTILRVRSVSFDWEVFVNEAESRRVQGPMAQALEYLRAKFGAKIPADVLVRLRRSRSSWWHRSLYAPMQSSQGSTRAAAARTLLYIWFFETAGEPLRVRLMWLARNLQYGWGLKSLAAVPVAMIRRTFDSSRGLRSP